MYWSGYARYTEGKETVMVHEGTFPMRKAWYAGSWYAAEPDLLRRTITGAVQQVAESNGGNSHRGTARLAVLPHAGLAYSSRGIAHLVVHAPKRIDRVVILAPSHTTAIPDDTLSFGLFSGFDTPLGSLRSFMTRLESKGPDVTIPLQREHAVEMVLPFLAYLQEQQQAPISVAMALISRVTDVSHAARIAGELVGALGEDELESSHTMVIASSDFTHYGQRFGYAPFGVHVDEKVQQKVKQEDVLVATALSRSELGPLFLTQRMKRMTICGIAAASVLSALAKRIDTSGWVADYYTSLDVLGEQATDFVAYGTILWR